MTFETLALGLLAGYFIWRLYRSIFKETQHQPNKIRLVSKQTGEVLEMLVLPQNKATTKKEWNEGDFINESKLMFQSIMTAYSNDKLKDVKSLMTSDVYTALEKDIDLRRQNKMTMDFSLVCFDEVNISYKSKDMSEITISFITEQINLLKDENGTVIEGDPMSIATVTDTWSFRKLSHQNWVLFATQSQPHAND